MYPCVIPIHGDVMGCLNICAKLSLGFGLFVSKYHWWLPKTGSSSSWLHLQTYPHWKSVILRQKNFLFLLSVIPQTSTILQLVLDKSPRRFRCPIFEWQSVLRFQISWITSTKRGSPSGAWLTPCRGSENLEHACSVHWEYESSN